MKARWGTLCAKCDTQILQGEELKAQYRRVGYDPNTGKPVWQRVPKQYVHAPRCPKVTVRRPPPSVDPRTGEVLVAESSPIPRHTQETLPL
jgi:hypothetical protein